MSIEDGEFAITSRFCICCCCTAVTVLPPPLCRTRAWLCSHLPLLLRKARSWQAGVCLSCECGLMTSIKALTSASSQVLEQEECSGTAAGWSCFLGLTSSLMSLSCGSLYLQNTNIVPGIWGVSYASFGMALLLPRRYEFQPSMDQQGSQGASHLLFDLDHIQYEFAWSLNIFPIPQLGLAEASAPYLH